MQSTHRTIDHPDVVAARELMSECKGNAAEVARRLRLPPTTVRGWRDLGWLGPAAEALSQVFAGNPSADLPTTAEKLPTISDRDGAASRPMAPGDVRDAPVSTERGQASIPAGPFDEAPDFRPPDGVPGSERERLQLAEIKRLKSALSAKQRGEDKIILEVKEALAELDIRPFDFPATIPGPYTSRSREHLMLLISDTQIGQMTPTFDLAIAEERTMQITERFLRIADVRSAHAEIAGVTIYWNGDAVEGEQIYGGQHWHIEVGVGPQATKWGPEIHVKSALAIAKEMPRPIRIRSRAGNHGRVGVINLPSSPQTNWDLVCYETARLMLEKAAPDAFDFGNPPEDWYLVDRLPGGWGVMLTHGDMIGGGGTSTSIITAGSGWAENIPEPWDYLMLGHFHKPWFLQTRGGTRDIYVNGAVASDDSDFVRGRMKAGGRPCQRMFVLTEERGIIEAPILYPEKRRPVSHFRMDAAS